MCVCVNNLPESRVTGTEITSAKPRWKRVFVCIFLLFVSTDGDGSIEPSSVHVSASRACLSLYLC